MTDVRQFEEAWTEFFASVRRMKGRLAEAEQDDLSLSQLHLLIALAASPSLPVGELALAAGVSAPTATRMLDGLERDGIVIREPSPDDRRKVTVSLTDEGRRLVQRKRRQGERRRRAVYDSLSQDEREHATHLLHRFAELLDEL
jgi:MarR family transcriptional regulator, organic hydroperoxide resistance regulator